MKVSGRIEALLLRLTRRPRGHPEPAPLLVELLDRAPPRADLRYANFPFIYHLTKVKDATVYGVSCDLPPGLMEKMRETVAGASAALEPDSVDPITFERLVEVLTQLSAERLALAGGAAARELAELAAYEAMGLSRMLAIAKDACVTEFFVDSETSPIYLDHVQAGRCETAITLTARERHALETHLDTFRGYTPDYATPSLKNDLEMSGARLRVSLDLAPVSVNRFALDVRRLNISSLPLGRLIEEQVISADAASLLVAWLETGGNITVIGETGTGKTTLLNALDEQVEPKLRRLYIEDAVETKDLLALGYHQMKVKVDPFERGGDGRRTKESEIVKALHRSPDLVVLSEIQSEEHSRAFFHALSAGARGIQTFHAPSIEQALRRWVKIHGIAEESLLDLGLLVMMVRPDRLKPGRFVQRVCAVESCQGAPKLKELYSRKEGSGLEADEGVEGWASTVAVPGAKLTERRRMALSKIFARG